MKILLTTVILALILVVDTYSQSDTLLINLKNSQVDKIAISQIQNIEFENSTSVENQNLIENELSVKGNNPNPFTDQTNIEFEIASPGTVFLIIYDNSGNQVNTLECSNCQAGRNILTWNCFDSRGSRVLSGVYYYEVHFGHEIQSKKMILVK